MKSISLVDTKNKNIITINADSFVLRLEIDGISTEMRLKSYMSSLLYELFINHPHPLYYEKIVELLKEHNLIISDVTRMHRKLSEIRTYISKFHPTFKNLILNIRGVGYGLPLHLKQLNQVEPKKNILLKNNKINNALEELHNLINETIDIISQSKIIKHPQGYIIHHDPIKNLLVGKISIFNKCEKIILQEIRTEEIDYTEIRISYILAKLKIYIGLVRISAYPVSEAQWLEWFRHKVWLLFDELKSLIKMAENQ